MKSRWGICKESPRIGKDGRRGVVGLSVSAVSSFDLFSGSVKIGEGERPAELPSDNDRVLEGDFDGFLESRLPFRDDGTSGRAFLADISLN